MKKRILILTFAGHVTDEQAEIIAQTHRNATGFYSSAELATATTISVDDVINDKEMTAAKFDVSEFIPSDPIAEMAKHFEPKVWAKIVANYDPIFAVECGCDLKTACENESKPPEFLNNAFDWHDSPEKDDYWYDIYKSLKEKGL